MKTGRSFLAFAVFLLLGSAFAAFFIAGRGVPGAYAIELPEPDRESGIPVSRAIHGRKSVRNYSAESLTLDQAGQLLWAAGGATIDGVTGPTRSYPSAGGTYPLEIYLVSGNVEGLEAGLYKYHWRTHSLEMILPGDKRSDLASAAYGQRMIGAAPATIVVTAVYERTTRRYGDRGRELYVPMDAGHLGQNVHLQAESMGLGTVMVGAFFESQVASVLEEPEGDPIYMMPVGYIAD